MKATRASAGLIGVIITSGIGAVVASGKGAKDYADAKELMGTADEKRLAREAASERRHVETNERVMALGDLQQQCQADVLDRMRDFLQRNEKQIRNSRRLIADGVDVAVDLVQEPSRLDVGEIRAWVTGAASSITVGAGAGRALDNAVRSFGTARTGRRISGLSGAAQKNALKAFAGGGPIAQGGGGIKRGELLIRGLTVSSGLLVGALVTGAKGKKALADAHAYATTVSVWCDRQAIVDAYLDAVDLRVTELETVMLRLSAAAQTELEVLESLEPVPFDIEAHGTEFQRAWLLVLALRDVANTPLLTSDGELDQRSETVIVKYRQSTKENDDA